MKRKQNVQLPGEPDLHLLARQTYELICEDLSWVYRRKEAVTLLDQLMTRRQVSVDFALPADVAPLTHTRQGEPVRYAPLFMLRKAPSRFTRFDLRNETGAAIALPTRSENGRLAGGVLLHAARKQLRAEPTPAVVAELSKIAAEYPPRSRGLAARFETDRSTGERRALLADASFVALMWSLADSSVLSIPIVSDSGMRRVLKLSFDAPIADLDYDPTAYRYGFRGYTAVFDLPFIGARNYHFELQCPAGLEIMEAGFVDAADAKRLRIARSFSPQLHFYSDDALTSRKALVHVQLRVSGDGFLGAAALASVLVAASVTACWAFAGELREATTAAPSLLMLFPGLVANYLARPAHRLTEVLLANARRVVLLSGAIAFITAARLAVIAKNQPAAECTLKWEFGALAVIAWLLALVLLVARDRRIPRPLTAQRHFHRRVARAGAKVEIAQGPFSSPGGSEL
jgi:hypothetical protein